MKKLSVLFTALLLLASCSKGYKVTVTLPDDSNNGETAFLTNYDTGDTIATATVENNMCTFEGDAGDGFFARLYVGGNPYGFIVEPGEVNLNIAEGNAVSPLNDKIAAWSKEMQKIADDSTLTEAENDARYAEELLKLFACFLIYSFVHLLTPSLPFRMQRHSKRTGQQTCAESCAETDTFP